MSTIVLGPKTGQQNTDLPMDVHDFYKFENFRENFIFAKSIIRHICHVKNWRLRHDLLTSVNDRVISPFCEGLFSQMAKIKPSRKFPNLQYSLNKCFN